MPTAWTIKSEPDDYSYEKLEKDKRTQWTGIRNFTARNNLKLMKPGDLALFFHTGKVKALVGIAKVLGEPADDPTEPGEGWASIELGPLKPLVAPVTLATLKATAATKGMQFVKQGRLSVGAVTKGELDAVLKLAKTKL
jgi:predicted RNA-binding protein with PUA-like domain